jgi:hypothetical protein
MSRKISRKVIIALAAAAALAAPLLGSSASYARGFGFAGGGMHFAARGGMGGGHAVFAHRVTGTHFTRVGRVGRIHPIFPRNPRHPIWISHLHHHHHWIMRAGQWVDVDDAAIADVTPAPTAAVTPGPCTCLTKTYTPAGLVVFADICTKESASAPAADDAADASQAPSTPVPAKATPIAEVPTAPNYAGKTYDDYLAANPQNANPQASAQGPQQN